MVAIAKTIMNDIFVDEWTILNESYISWLLHLYSKKHTQERLAQTLDQLVDCGYLEYTTWWFKVKH